MKKHLNKVLFAALFALLLACVMGITISAATTEVGTAADFATAVNNAAAGDTIKITSGFTLTAKVDITKSLTITSDSAVTVTYTGSTNHALACGTAGVTLTLGGQVTWSADAQRVVNMTANNVNLILEDNVVCSGSNALYLAGGTGSSITVRGNAAVNAVKWDCIEINSSALDNITVTIEGNATLTSPARCAIRLANAKSGGKITINANGGTLNAAPSGSFKNSNNIATAGAITLEKPATLNINGATITQSTLAWFGAIDVTAACTINVNSGIVQGTGASTAGILLRDGVSTVNINGGTVTGKGYGIQVHHAGSAGGTVTVKGDAVVSGGNAILTACKQPITINVQENAALTSTSSNSISINHNDTAGTVNAKVTINVSGGTLTAGTGNAIYVHAKANTEDAITITDGTFVAPNSDVISVNAAIEVTVSGGSFSAADTGSAVLMNAAAKLDIQGGTFADALYGVNYTGSSVFSAETTIAGADFSGVQIMIGLQANVNEISVGEGMMYPTSGQVFRRATDEIYAPLFSDFEIEDLYTFDDLLFYDTEEHALANLSVRIGDDYYATLAIALDNAGEGQTITLIKDVVESVTIEISVTIEGDKILTGTVTVADSATLTLSGNLTVSGAVVVAGYESALVVEDHATVTSTKAAIVLGEASESASVTVKGNATVYSSSTSGVNDSDTAAGAAILVRTGAVDGVISIEDSCSVTAKTFPIRFYAAATLYIKGGYIAAVETGSRDAIHVATAVPDDDKVVIEMTGGEMTAVRYGFYVMNSTDFTMTGGSITGVTNFWNEFENAGQDPKAVNITIGGDAVVECNGIGFRTIADEFHLTVGGNASFTATSYFVSGINTSSNNCNGGSLYITIADDAVITANGTYGICAASTTAGHHLELTVTGGSFTSTTGVAVYSNGSGSSLTMSGGSITSAGTMGVQFNKAGSEITMTGGTISVIKETDSESWRGVIDVTGNANVEITGGTLYAPQGTYKNTVNGILLRGENAEHIVHIGGDANIDVNYCGMFVYYATGSAEVTIDGNARLSGSVGLQVQGTMSSTVEISGNAQLIGSSSAISHTVNEKADPAAAEITISGGTFTGIATAALNITMDDNITITGGTFISNVTGVRIGNAGTDLSISGTTSFADANMILRFTEDCTDGTVTVGGTLTIPTTGMLYALSVEDGTQPTITLAGITPVTIDNLAFYDTVQHAASNAVALIGEQYYNSLADAIAAANAYSDGATTITLLKDITIDTTITVADKNVILTGNGITVSTITSTTGYRIFNVTGNAKLTLMGSVTFEAYNRAINIKTTDAAEVYITVRGNAKLKSLNNTVIFNESGSAATKVSVTVQNSGVIIAGSDDSTDGWYGIYNQIADCELYVNVSGNALIASPARTIWTAGRLDLTMTGGTIRQHTTLKMKSADPTVVEDYDLILMEKVGEGDSVVNKINISGGSLIATNRYAIYARNATEFTISGGTHVSERNHFYDEYSTYQPVSTKVTLSGSASVSASGTCFQMVGQVINFTISGTPTLTSSGTSIAAGSSAGTLIFTVTGEPTINAGNRVLTSEGSGKATVNIAGGTFTTEGKSHLFRFAAADTSEITITGGRFIVNNTATKIDDETGDLVSATAPTAAALSFSNGVTANIYGGTFVSKLGSAIKVGHLADVTIWGGTFVCDPDEIPEETPCAVAVVGAEDTFAFLTVNGGSFVAKADIPVFYSVHEDNTLDLDSCNTAGGTAVMAGAEIVNYAPGATTWANNSIVMRDGASVRLVSDSNGLRFIGSMSSDAVAHLKTIGATNISYGTLLLPTDLLAKATAFTLADLVKDGVQYLNVPASDGLVGSDATGWAIRTALINIKTGNIARAFSAVAYVTYTVNGQTVTQYAAYSAENSSRSIAEVAYAALNSGDSYSPDQTAVLEGFAAYYNNKIAYRAPVAMLPTFNKEIA